MSEEDFTKCSDFFILPCYTAFPFWRKYLKSIIRFLIIPAEITSIHSVYGNIHALRATRKLDTGHTMTNIRTLHRSNPPNSSDERPTHEVVIYKAKMKSMCIKYYLPLWWIKKSLKKKTSGKRLFYMLYKTEFDY
jgi:hypothetical protein